MGSTEGSTDKLGLCSEIKEKKSGIMSSGEKVHGPSTRGADFLVQVQMTYRERSSDLDLDNQDRTQTTRSWPGQVETAKNHCRNSNSIAQLGHLQCPGKDKSWPDHPIMEDLERERGGAWPEPDRGDEQRVGQQKQTVHRGLFFQSN
ncbi:hypothetical protein JTB14_032958 [Gonioctena quinquepunctata]|nr:hypothetical protein JTB14_032958 [Gonioctena quinquepunctata]